MSRTYGGATSVAALKSVSLRVRDGDFVCFVGPSGSGKSTLLNLIALLDMPTAGRYRIDGTDVATLRRRERVALRTATFGFVFQSFHLLGHYSAIQNVELALLYRGMRAGERRRRAAEALERVGLGHRADHSASKLSGGESQRVAIARAVVADAPILVADEPTGNLDTENSMSIVALLHALNRSGTTIVLVTHDSEVAASAGRRTELRDGVVVSETRRGRP